jgi:hypothetical protein
MHVETAPSRTEMHRTARGQGKLLRCLQNLIRLKAWFLPAIPLDCPSALPLENSISDLLRQISLTSKLTRSLRIPEAVTATTSKCIDRISAQFIRAKC